MAKNGFLKRRVLVLAFVALLAACGSDEPVETAESLRDLDGEVVTDTASQVPDSLAPSSQEVEPVEQSPETTTPETTIPAQEPTETPPASETSNPPSTTTPVTSADADEESLIAAYQAVTQAGANRETVIPWFSDNCRAPLGLVSDDDPLSLVLADQELLEEERPVIDVQINGNEAILLAGDNPDSPLPYSWVFEEGEWRFGPCSTVDPLDDFTLVVSPDEEGLRERLAQLQQLKSADELTIYPWLSWRCRQDTVRTQATSVVGFLDALPVWGPLFEFHDVEIRAIAETGVAVTSSVQPTSAHAVDGLRASEWVYENGNWQHDICGSDTIPEGFDQDAATFRELHTPFTEASRADTNSQALGVSIPGLENGELSGNSQTQYYRYRIISPSTEEAGNDLIIANVVPVIEALGYSYQGVVDGVHRLTLDANECGVIDARVDWPTSTEPAEIEVKLFRAC